MQLVVVAGGFGTRLRPLTFARPKALLPLLNRPQILHLFDRFPDSIDEVLIAANYGFAQLRDFFKGQDLGRRVVVVEEPEPLGTGGALKNVEGHIGGSFAAYNGDVVDSLDLAAFVRFHRTYGRIASLAVWPVEDPSAFGVVALEGTRVTKFVEKPKKVEAPSNLVNAGRYVFEPEIFDFIESGREVSMEREVFPKLIAEGVHAFRYEGFWSDAGTLSSYLRAQSLLLEAGHASVSPRSDVSRAQFRAPVLVPDGCFVEGIVGPNVVLGRGTRIARATVSDAALLEGASVDDRADVGSSIVGSGAAIGEGAVVKNSIIGDGVLVEPYAKVVEARLKA